jgi:hypothetical protein
MYLHAAPMWKAILVAAFAVAALIWAGFGSSALDLAGALAARLRAASSDPAALAADLQRALLVASDALISFGTRGLERAPVLMLGLGALALVVPLAALAGFSALRRRRVSAVRAEVELAPWPVEGWLRLEGPRGAILPIRDGMLRIGRDDDNELRVPHRSIGPYHAVVQRTPEAEYIITDVSGIPGSGIAVNGARLHQASLRHGDIVQVGAVRMRFEAHPI